MVSIPNAEEKASAERDAIRTWHERAREVDRAREDERMKMLWSRQAELSRAIADLAALVKAQKGKP